MPNAETLWSFPLELNTSSIGIGGKSFRLGRMFRSHLGPLLFSAAIVDVAVIEKFKHHASGR